LADAGDLDADELVLGLPCRAVHALEAPADQEHGVADDRAAQRDLEHDQRRCGLVSAQGRKDGTQFHVDSPVSYCDLSWIAGATWQACQAGNSPASTLARIASAKVVSSIDASRCRMSAKPVGCCRIAHRPSCANPSPSRPPA